ncbi:MAG: DUF1893 domain-containing protein [Coprobacillus sp.]
MDKAIGILKQNRYTFVALREDLVYHSTLNGIAPIMNKMVENELFFKDCEIADKVIGKSAAMLLIKSQIKHLDTILISEHAIKILDKYHISYTYEQVVPYIINRTNDGMCPMENSVLNIDDLDEGFETLKATLKLLRENMKK